MTKLSNDPLLAWHEMKARERRMNWMASCLEIILNEGCCKCVNRERDVFLWEGLVMKRLSEKHSLFDSHFVGKVRTLTRGVKYIRSSQRVSGFAHAKFNLGTDCGYDPPWNGNEKIKNRWREQKQTEIIVRNRINTIVPLVSSDAIIFNFWRIFKKNRWLESSWPRDEESNVFH